MMKFQNTSEAWTKHSGNLLFMAKSLLHSQKEYSKVRVPDEDETIEHASQHWQRQR
jgi:hypothetical protein